VVTVIQITTLRTGSIYWYSTSLIFINTHHLTLSLFTSMGNMVVQQQLINVSATRLTYNHSLRNKH